MYSGLYTRIQFQSASRGVSSEDNCTLYSQHRRTGSSITSPQPGDCWIDIRKFDTLQILNTKESHRTAGGLLHTSPLISAKMYKMLEVNVGGKSA